MSTLGDITFFSNQLNFEKKKYFENLKKKIKIFFEIFFSKISHKVWKNELWWKIIIKFTNNFGNINFISHFTLKVGAVFIKALWSPFSNVHCSSFHNFLPTISGHLCYNFLNFCNWSWFFMLNSCLCIAQNQQSRGLKSGLFAGHGIGLFLEIILSPNFSVKNSITIFAVWQGAPSCIHQMLLKYDFLLREGMIFFWIIFR